MLKADKKDENAGKHHFGVLCIPRVECWAGTIGQRLRINERVCLQYQTQAIACMRKRLGVLCSLRLVREVDCSDKYGLSQDDVDE